MIVSRYGIRLIKLEQEHIELLRNWRNAEKISRYMEYREYITPEMQQLWFASLSDERDFYFMIEYRGNLVGMIHASGIDWEQGTGDAGLFIYEDRYLSTYTPVLASLCMVDLFFGVFSLEKLYAKVMGNNPVAERYNRSLGFKPMKLIDGSAFRMFELKKDDYFAATDKLRNKAIAIEGNDFSIELSYSQMALLDRLDAFGAAAKFELFVTLKE